jgi:hypothetical protein
MTVDETADGTPVIELTPEEYEAYRDREVRRLTGMGATAFVRAYEAGELDDADPAVSESVALLRIGQDGHSVVT